MIQVSRQFSKKVPVTLLITFRLAKLSSSFNHLVDFSLSNLTKLMSFLCSLKHVAFKYH